MARIVCVTACITGIAHTYMAAEALEQAGKKMGHEVIVETQGSAGSNPVKQEIIDGADAVIFAVDLEVKDRDRFNGKPFIQTVPSKAIKDAVGLVEQALAAAADGSAPKVGESSSAIRAEPSSNEPGKKKGGFLGGLFGKN